MKCREFLKLLNDSGYEIAWNGSSFEPIRKLCAKGMPPALHPEMVEEMKRLEPELKVLLKVR